MSALAILPVDQGRVLRHPVVPDDHRPGLPLDAGLEVGSECEVVVQELEEGVGFLLLETDNLSGDCRLNISKRRAHVFNQMYNALRK